MTRAHHFQSQYPILNQWTPNIWKLSVSLLSCDFCVFDFGMWFLCVWPWDVIFESITLRDSFVNMTLRHMIFLGMTFTCDFCKYIYDLHTLFWGYNLHMRFLIYRVHLHYSFQRNFDIEHDQHDILMMTKVDILTYNDNPTHKKY